jgi:hypothetical protein
MSGTGLSSDLFKKIEVRYFVIPPHSENILLDRLKEERCITRAEALAAIN